MVSVTQNDPTDTLLPSYQSGSRVLQANMYLEKDLAPSLADQGPDCELCASGSASHKCVQCQLLYCAPCRHTHDSIPACTSHTVLPLGGQGVGSGQEEGGAATAERNCGKHKGQVLILFCRQCEVSICIQCKLTSHEGHETEDVVNTGQRARAALGKEVDSLAQREQALKALLSKGEDFKADLESERRSVEQGIRSRSERLQSMVARTRDNSLESLKGRTSAALSALQAQLQPVKLALEAVSSKSQHYSRAMKDEGEGEVLTLLSRMKSEQKGVSEQIACENELRVERSAIEHVYSDAAVGESDVADFLGTAAEGQAQTVKIQTVSTLSVQETLRPLSAKKRGSASATSRMNAKEIVYSKNGKAKLVDMCLAADEKVWIVYQFSCQMMALLDARGRKLEQRYETIHSGLRLACDGDTLVSLSDGKFAGPDGKSGNLGQLAEYQPNDCSLSRPSPHYYICRAKTTTTSVQATQHDLMYGGAAAYMQQVRTADIFRIATVASSPPQLDTAPVCSNITDASIFNRLNNTTFAVSADEKFFAFGTADSSARVYHLTTGTPGELKLVEAYAVTDASGKQLGGVIDDLMFCQADGEEVLLVAVSALNTVHVVDHKDGCCFVRTLETDQRALDRPFRLATNHQGRVWIGCHGGKVVILDL